MWHSIPTPFMRHSELDQVDLIKRTVTEMLELLRTDAEAAGLLGGPAVVDLGHEDAVAHATLDVETQTDKVMWRQPHLRDVTLLNYKYA